MLKKIVAILIPLIIIGGGVYFFIHQKKIMVPENSVIKAIPIDASFIIETHKTLPLLKIISQNCDIWKELTDMPYFIELNRQYKKLDSIAREHAELGDILENEPLFISAHTNGMNHFNYLFTCAVPANLQSTLSVFLGSLRGNTPSNNLQYEETTIHCIQLDDKNAFYYAIQDGIFISSFGPALVKESLRQIESGISLMNNAYFTKVLNASGMQVEANVFVNLQTFTNVASALFNRGFYSTLSSVQDFGQWMGLDVTVNPDEVIMTGVTSCDSIGTQFLNLFQRQSSYVTKATSIVPANTIFMLCHEFTDYPLFYKNYVRYLGIHNKNRGREEWLNRIEQDYGMNLEKCFLPWISNELAEVITEPSDSTLQDNTYVLVGANDINVAINKLSTLADSIASKKNIPVFDSTYMHHEIRNLRIDNITGNLLGSSFDGVTKSWFAPVGNYIVFANSLNSLETFIYEYEQGNLLEKDSYYKDYVNQHVESESGIYVYNNLSLSSILYAKYLDKTYIPDFKKYKAILNKYHGLSLQFSYMQGMFYTNIYLKRNPVMRQEVTPMWQVQLDTLLASAPYWVTDYATHEQYVMAQDKNKSVYFINTNGQIQWKEQIDGYLQSPIFQVDALRNRKIQYIFNTENKITLLDRKGDIMSGYPVKLKSSTNTSITVADFDNNRKYKLLVPCNNLKVYEYDINGKPAKGWDIPKTNEVVQCPVHYCRVAKKDYLILIDHGGRVYIVDRKGKEELNLDNRMPSHLKDFYVFAGNSLSDSYITACDSSGTVFILSLSGELSTHTYVNASPNAVQFIPGPKDSNGKQEMFFLNGADIWAYNADKTERFHDKLKDKSNNSLLLFTYPDGSLNIGASDTKDDKIYVWDNTGKIFPGFPLHGSGNFSIGNMKNDNSLYLVTGSGNKIAVYALP